MFFTHEPRSNHSARRFESQMIVLGSKLDLVLSSLKSLLPKDPIETLKSHAADDMALMHDMQVGTGNMA